MNQFCYRGILLLLLLFGQSDRVATRIYETRSFSGEEIHRCDAGMETSRKWSGRRKKKAAPGRAGDRRSFPWSSGSR